MSEPLTSYCTICASIGVLPDSTLCSRCLRSQSDARCEGSPYRTRSARRHALHLALHTPLHVGVEPLMERAQLAENECMIALVAPSADFIQFTTLSLS